MPIGLRDVDFPASDRKAGWLMETANPRLYGPAPRVLAIVQYGAKSAETNGGIANSGCLTLRRELAAVDADHRDLVREQRLELPQPRKDMIAVVSAVGPEVQQQQLAPKVGEREPAAA